MAIAVGVGLAAVGLLCFKLGAVATTALVSVVLIIAGVEFFTTTLRAGYQPATLLGMVAIVGLAWGRSTTCTRRIRSCWASPW